MSENTRKNAVMTKTYDAVNRILQWTFADSTKVEFTVPTMVSDDPTAEQAMIHGYAQKIGDAAALGAGSTNAEKREAMLAVVETLNGGAWNATRGEGDNATFLARAIAEVDGKDIEKVKAWLKTKTPAERAKFATVERFAAKIADYRKARVANVDTSKAEAELEGL